MAQANLPFIKGDDDKAQQNASADGDTTTVIRYKCTPCSKHEGNIKEALHFCTECNEFYCDQCFGYHRRMGQLQHHVVYGKSDRDKWGKNIQRQQLTEKCVKHPTETVNMFCSDDNELCCHVCVSLEHSTCNNKKYIPRAARGILETDELREIKSQLKVASTSTDKYKESYKGFSHDLDNKQTLVLQQLTDLRREMNDMFDKMEEKAIVGVTYFSNILSTSIREEINVCKDLKKEMTQVTLKLESEDNKDECDVFINIVKAKKLVQKANRVMNELQYSKSIQNIADELQFDTNRNLSKQLQEIKLGQVSCRYNINCTRLKCVNDNCDCYGHRTSCKILGCFIEGIVQLEDGTFILADTSHFCLTWISQTYKVKDCVKLTEPPSALCITGPTKIAVCLPNKLEVFKISDDITHLPHLGLRFQHRCCGLAFFNQRYYMTDHNATVYIYNKKGHCIKTIKTKYIFETVRNIAVGEEAGKVYVTDIVRGLITLDMNGSVVSTLETKETNGAYGVCVTSDGHVLVSNYLTDSVIKVDKEGKNVLQKNLISLPSGQSPRSICYDRNNSCILISNNHFEGSEFLSVFLSQ